MKVCRSKGFTFAYALVAICVAAICMVLFVEEFCPRSDSSILSAPAYSRDDSKGGGGGESDDEPTEYA